MDITDFISYHGGLARSSDLVAAGFSRHALNTALSVRSLVRVARGWVAAHGSDPALVFAARSGALLSCITQAERLGLWIPKKSHRPHVAARSPNGRVRAANCVVHWAQPLVPRAPHLLEDPLENVLALVSACQPAEDALVVWESALNKQLTDIRSLERLPLSGRAKVLLARCTPFADSGLETIVRDRFKWLKIRILIQVHVLGHRVDMLFGDRLVVQIDGRTHQGAQRRLDNRHDAELRRNGYEVIRVSYEQVMFHWEEVHEAVLGAIARGFHLAPAA